MTRRNVSRKLSASIRPVLESLEQRLQLSITLIDAPNIHALEKPYNTQNVSAVAQNYNYIDAHTARFQWGDNTADTVQTV